MLQTAPADCVQPRPGVANALAGRAGEGLLGVFSLTNLTNIGFFHVVCYDFKRVARIEGVKKLPENRVWNRLEGQVFLATMAARALCFSLFRELPGSEPPDPVMGCPSEIATTENCSVIILYL